MNLRNLALLWLSAIAPVLQGCIPALVAGGGAAVLVAEDRRSAGTIVDDKTIEGKVRSRISEKYDDQVHVDVTSFNRFVLVIGQVPSQDIKDAIGAIALGVENVRNVQNELSIAPNTSASTRAKDGYLTGKVKARFVSEHKFQPNHVVVITEDAVVYLLGLVKKQEADDAAEIASTTPGVQKVVKVFEYL